LIPFERGSGGSLVAGVQLGRYCDSITILIGNILSQPAIDIEDAYLLHIARTSQIKDGCTSH
jgi:hypothetical protein